MVGYGTGLIVTITFALVFRQAMPALLFILPMQLICIFATAYLSYGAAGVTYLVSFDEEKALKTGQQITATSKLPLK